MNLPHDKELAVRLANAITARYRELFPIDDAQKREDRARFAHFAACVASRKVCIVRVVPAEQRSHIGTLKNTREAQP